MDKIIIALFIGVIAGIIDIIPMIIQKMNKWAVVSAFSHWVFLGLIIPFVSWSITSWLKGMIIGLAAAVPVLLMVAPQEKKAIIPISIMSALLGAGIGFAGSFFGSSKFDARTIQQIMGVVIIIAILFLLKEIL